MRENSFANVPLTNDGAKLTMEMIDFAYRIGCFPMANDEGQIDWYQPRRRALLPIEGIYLSQSTRKVLKKRDFRITFDTAFEKVIRSCRRPEDNWIDENIIRVFTEVHEDGWAHSCEVWSGEELVGGTYGIALGACFCAESMFHSKTNMSKVAIWAMVEKCRELGFELFDAQVMTSHLRTLGAFEISASNYENKLIFAMQKTTPWSPYEFVMSGK